MYCFECDRAEMAHLFAIMLITMKAPITSSQFQPLTMTPTAFSRVAAGTTEKIANSITTSSSTAAVRCV